MAATPEFQSAPRPPAWRQQLASFWRWWSAEIAALLPERLAVLGGASRVPLLAFEADEVALVEPRAVPGETRVNLAALEETRRAAALRALLERAGENRGRARLLLGRDEALVRRVTLPAATEENLPQVLAFEMDRLTPFRAEDVYFDHRIVARDAAGAQVTVQIAVARRETVDALVQRMRTLGVSLQGIAVRDDIDHGAQALDLLPPEQRGARASGQERMIQRALAAAVLALFVLVLLFPVWQKREMIIALHPILATEKGEAEATDSVARELEKQATDYNFLQSRKHGAYPALALLEEVSRLLPDNTWVQQFEVKTNGKTREVLITGETASSSKLIELLEQSSVLQNAAPRGTVTRGSQPGTERFMIAAEARPRAQPDARPLLDVVAAIPTPVAPITPAPNVAIMPAAPSNAPAGGEPPPTARVTPVKPAAPAKSPGQ